MNYYRQPWGRVTVTGHRCRLQVLDPVTAFDLEPQLIDRLGEPLAMALAAPRHVLGPMWSGIVGDEGYGSTFAEVVQHDDRRLEIAAAGLQRMAAMLRSCMLDARIDGGWIVTTFESLIFDRLRIDDHVVEDWDSWRATGLGAEARWRLLAAQMEQTYRPLWTRAPYSAGRKKPQDYGVPVPTSVPMAVQWADALVTMGHVSSAHEVVTAWTPVQLIDAVDLAAQHAENERRAMDAAKTQAR